MPSLSPPGLRGTKLSYYNYTLLLLLWEVIIDDDDEVETHNPVGIIAFHTRGIKLNVSSDR